MLGDFGVHRPEVDETFGYFGSVIRVHPDVSDVAIVEMYRGIPDLDPVHALDFLPSLAGTMVHPDDVDLFLSLAAKNRQTIEDIVTLGMKIVEALTARPTRLPSDSSAGQSTTSTSSMDGSSLRALRLLDGRPDLQVAIPGVRESAGATV